VAQGAGEKKKAKAKPQQLSLHHELANRDAAMLPLVVGKLFTRFHAGVQNALRCTKT
jgi:hypothetical protein